MPLNNYQITNGLEVRLQLKTENKIFCNELTKFRVASNLINNVNASNIELAMINVLIEETNSLQIENWFTLAIQQFPNKVIEYKKDKKGLIGLFVGEVIKISPVKTDPKISNELLNKALNN